MKSLYASTGLALVLGLGVAGADLPAQAADAIVLAQAESGAGGGAGGQVVDQGSIASGGQFGTEAVGQTGDQPGIDQQTGDDENGAVHPSEPSAAQPDYALRCDVDGDSFVNMSEARACYQQQFGTISGGSSHINPE